MIAYTNLTFKLWGDAISIASYIVNRVPSNPNTQNELWTGTKLNSLHLHLVIMMNMFYYLYKRTKGVQPSERVPLD